MSGLKYKQDMAPPGGYKDIYWKRTNPKVWFTAWKGFGVYAALGGLSYWYLRGFRKRARRGTLEENDTRLACDPFIMAERDRRLLRFWREFRDLETQLMGDVPGWKVGTFYGEPKYLTTPNYEDWWDQGFDERTAHSHPHKMDLVVGLWNRDEMSGNHWYTKYMPEWWHNWGAGTELPYKGSKFGVENI